MTITIHRGTHQIGGCVTEYKQDGWRLFVDYGEELAGGPKSGVLKVDGLTHGDLSKSALFITHYHGDHIGCITQLPAELPIYMGEVGCQIQRVVSNYMKSKSPVHQAMLERLEHVRTFKETERLSFGPFQILPLTMDHSAFDAYAFKISAGGVSVFHTGDFRLHGFRSGKYEKMLQTFVGKVDYVVCEGTNVSRPDASSKTERALQQDFETLFRENKCCVVYLSSTNIDRLFSLYHAALRAGRRFYVDEYQKYVMDTVVHSGSIWTRSPLYQYDGFEPKVLSYHKYKKNRFFVADRFKYALAKYGYVLIARPGERFDDLLAQIPVEKKVLSMWRGYLKEGSEAYNEALARALEEDYEYLHTSGHCDMQELPKVFAILRPSAIIPIHTDHPAAFERLFGSEWPVVCLHDGETFLPEKLLIRT